jgi:predicted Zn-dependent peptidase
MGFSEMFADHTWFENYIAKLSTVTVDDVQRAAQRYLKRSNRAVGHYVPKHA